MSNMETKWVVDKKQSEIGFKVKHMMISTVKGTFGEFKANATTEGDDFSTAKFDFSANINSINTGKKDRDDNLKSAEFFNADEFPELAFKSTEVIKKSDRKLLIHGDLTIRDTTKNIGLEAEIGRITIDSSGQTNARLTITGKIKRSEFGLKWSAITEAGGVVVSDEIKLNSEIQFIKQA